MFKMTKAKAISGVLAVFLLGAAAGSLVSMRCCRHHDFKGVPPAEAIVKRLDKKLSLDDTQRTQILKIVTDTQAQMQELRKESKPKMDAIFSGSEDKVRAVLRPDQRAKYEEVIAKWKERRARDEHNEQSEGR
jgi:hypothetical protein